MIKITMPRLTSVTLAIAGALYWIVVIATFAIHFWAVKLLYDFHGIAAAIVGFFTFIGTEIFCFLHIVFFHHEPLLSPYPISLMAYVAIFLLMLGSFMLTTQLEEKMRQRQ